MNELPRTLSEAQRYEQSVLDRYSNASLRRGRLKDDPAPLQAPQEPAKATQT